MAKTILTKERKVFKQESIGSLRLEKAREEEEQANAKRALELSLRDFQQHYSGLKTHQVRTCLHSRLFQVLVISKFITRVYRQT